MLINFLIFFTALCAFCGLALDIGIVQLRKLQLQHAADAAAIGAMYEKGRGNADWVAAGQADAALNGFTNGLNGVTVTIVNPPTSGAYSGNTSAFQATVTQTVHNSFLGMLGLNTMQPAAMAVAKSGSTTGCIYVMNSNATTFYPLELENTGAIASACSTYIDSSSKSIHIDSSSSLSVTGTDSSGATDETRVQGSVTGASIAGSVSPSPTYNSANQNDPLAGVTAPSFSSCNYMYEQAGNFILNLIFPNYTTLSPGTYCGGISSYNSYITFKPGLYIVTGGLNLTNSTLISSGSGGVTIYVTQGGGFGYSTVTMTNVNTTTLYASTDTSLGGVAGVLFFADRSWSDPGEQDIQLNNCNLKADGIWYALNTGIELNNNTVLGATNYLGIVTDNLELNNANINVPKPNYSSLTNGNPYPGAGSGSGGLVQ